MRAIQYESKDGSHGEVVEFLHRLRGGAVGGAGRTVGRQGGGTLGGGAGDLPSRHKRAPRVARRRTGQMHESDCNAGSACHCLYEVRPRQDRRAWAARYSTRQSTPMAAVPIRPTPASQLTSSASILSFGCRTRVISSSRSFPINSPRRRPSALLNRPDHRAGPQYDEAIGPNRVETDSPARCGKRRSIRSSH